MVDDLRNGRTFGTPTLLYSPLMIRPAFPLALLLVLLPACDSGSPGADVDPDDSTPPIQGNDGDDPAPPIEEDEDDGSVALADVYVADVAGVDAAFFRADLGGTCAEASLTLRFDASRFELECFIDRGEGQQDRYSPSGDFRYELVDRALRVTAFGYELNGVAVASGERIESSILSPSDSEIEADLLAQP